MNTRCGLDLNVLRVILLTAIFLVGYLESTVLKHSELAMSTWFIGLGAFTAWMVFPLTAIRIVFGVVVFVSGMALLIKYYKRTRGSN